MRYFALFPLFLFGVSAQVSNAQVVNTSHSPDAVLHPVPIQAVQLDSSSFWGQRRTVTLEKSMPTMFDELEQHGTLDNFRRLTGAAPASTPRKGPVYTDSDIYKWIEAAAFFLTAAEHPGAEADLLAKVDTAVKVIIAAQQPDGYLNTYYVGEKANLRFTEMHRSHELYCLGHLLQAAIALQRATGDRRLLDAGIRYADYVLSEFGTDKKPALTGHPELEMALVELYRQTGEAKYLKFAGYLLSGVETERLHLRPDQTTYMFSGIPFTSRTAFVGHAVRAMYAACGATDYYAETGDPAYKQTLDRLWQDEVRHKMYITGGVGSRSEGEAFGSAYELPNAQAYTESCAAIANYMWNWRMLNVEGDSRFADVMERALYNGINSGMSLDGTLYCYRNPLESSGEKIRNPFYDTDCCPPNIERTMGALPGYFYSTSARGLYVNLYGANTLDWHLENGTALKIAEQTNYPWDGSIDFTVTPGSAAEFSIYFRIPEWAQGTRLTVNGATQSSAAGHYAEVHRTWKAGDRVHITFDMTPRLTASNPLVRENAGRVAVERGPLVYCLEKPDQPIALSLFDESLELTPNTRFKEQRRADLLGGIVVLEHAGLAASKPLEDDPLYRDLAAANHPRERPVQLTFIPYYAWANRGQYEMEVWVPVANGGNIRAEK
ncbi:glycoside hydrolase family 127 protein [Nevskia soli]|uniref:glycoside hydrolase family 127 protein n=1 Tax=Nevskia soli TaxID=418856 RepID=UPI0015D6CC51|nr:beta-L-arabinofuranosidase domain-containing protein [Nevskia soli]